MVLSGENFQVECDVMIGAPRCFEYNPYIKKFFSSKCYNLSATNQLPADTRIIFMYSYCLNFKNTIVPQLAHLKKPFVILFHNSDRNFRKEDLCLFSSLPLLVRVYAQNMNVVHEKVSVLPIGVANRMWQHGNISFWTNIEDSFATFHTPKTNMVYFGFNTTTNKKKREECFNSIRKKYSELPVMNKLPFKAYVERLSLHKFCICPEGNGLDTHRFWESLYVRTVPICLKNHMITQFAERYPVVVLQKWEDLDMDALDAYYESIDWGTVKPLLNVHNYMTEIREKLMETVSK